MKKYQMLFKWINSASLACGFIILISDLFLNRYFYQTFNKLTIGFILLFFLIIWLLSEVLLKWHKHVKKNE